MKTTAVIWFSLFCFGINLQQGFGQCSNPTVFWRDADGDGFGDRNFLTDDIVDAQLDYESSDDTYFAISNNIAYGCSNNAPAGGDVLDLWVIKNSIFKSLKINN